jgi:hypothetical protein
VIVAAGSADAAASSLGAWLGAWLDSVGGMDAAADPPAAGELATSGVATGAESRPRTEPIAHQAPMANVAMTITKAIRRSQYTPGGSGPTGCIRLLTGTTVAGART